MKRVVLLSALISTSCFASFDGYTQKSYSNGSYLKTQFTTNDTAQLHIGCGIGTDGNTFTVIALKHPALYPIYGRNSITLSIDGQHSVSLDGGTKQYDDMYYSKNPSKGVIENIRAGKLALVNFSNGKESVEFSLKGSNAVYYKLWKECGLL